MTNRQKIQIKQSEVRERINVLLSQEERNEAEGNELRELTTKAQTLETEFRAAVVSEGEEEGKARGEFRDKQDGESAEIRALFGRVTLGDYLTPARAGNGIVGAAVELAAALKVPTIGPNGGAAIPFDMLECRAFTDTGSNDGGEMQRPILQRLFGPGVLDHLGVRVDSVPVGRSEWPLITGGVAPAQTKEGTAAAAAVEAPFSYANLKAKKLTGKYEFTHELAASVPEIEAALRRDLGDAVKAKMSDSIINGLAPTNTNPHYVQGFLTTLTGTDLSTAKAAFADYGRLHALGVDGIHAEMETQVMSVIGIKTYEEASGTYQSGSGESGSEALKRRSGGCIASSFIPAVASTKQSCILHSAGGGGMMRGDSVAAVWPTLEVIRDIYTQASQGTVLTWVLLWDAKVAFRSSAYKQVDIQVTA